MEDVNISKYRASVVREGSKPASPGFVVSEGQSPTDPAGTGQNHLPVTIAAASTGLSITESQILSGAGTVSQYIRGDGSLADFPESSGGGSSISYYLNGSINQGTIGGVAYKELSKVPILGAGTDFTINADGYIASFLTDAGDPNLLEIPGGNWNFETYFSSSSSGGTPTFYVELYKYDGTTFTLIASNSGSPEFIAFGTTLTAYFSTLAVPTTTLALTDRLAVRYYVTHSGRTITLHTEDNHLCQIVTTFTTGLTALNGLTAQVQNFAVGTSGTDFNIASATATHTFNLPTASGTNRGALSSTDWTTFNNKENAISAGTTAQYFRGDKTFQTLNTSVVPELTNLYYTEARVNANANVAANTAARHNAVTLGTANGLSLSTQVLSLGLASAGVTGALSGTDWSTFNSKQNALTLTTTGSSGAATLVGSTLNIPNYSPDLSGYVPTSRTITINGTTQDLSANRTFNVGTVTSVGLSSATSGVTIGSTPVTTSGTITLAIATASGSQNGLLSSTDWTTFNSKQNALTNPVTGTGTTNYLAKFTGSTTVGNSQVFDNGTNVGIGINSPSNKLDVLGSAASPNLVGTNAYARFYQSGGYANVTIGALASGSFAGWIQTSDGVGTALPLSLQPSGGNLLVGTTTDSGYKLDVNGTGRFSGALTLSVGNNQVRSGNEIRFYRPDNLVYTQLYDGGNPAGFILDNRNGNGFDFQSVGTSQFKITSSGNVGIGTTSPSNGRLEVLTSSAVSYNPAGFNVVNLALRSGSGTTTGSIVGLTMGLGGSAETMIGAVQTASGTADIVFQSFNGSAYGERMRITSGGNLLVGTTTDNGARLQVSGTARINAGSLSGTFGLNIDVNSTFAFGSTNGRRTATITRDSGDKPGLQFGYDATDNTGIIAGATESLGAGLDFYTYNGSSWGNRMRITSGGNVGIGTASPNSKLHIAGDFRTVLTSGVGGDTLIAAISGVSNGYIINVDTSNNITHTWNTGANAAALRITPSGNVLIGSTTDNGSKLQVNGAIRTAQPVGTTSNGWLLGRALVSGTSTPNRWIRVQIGLEYYDILAVYMGTL